ncbi:hypothetical protein ACROYT_G007141 [Oculina patagonica]
MILCETLPGYAMLMSPYKDETAVHGCHSTEFDECSSSPCLNGGTCTDGVNNFTCSCPSPFFGHRCQEFDECSSSPCLNGGTCVDGVYNFTCVCPSVYIGKRCEEKQNYNRKTITELQTSDNVAIKEDVKILQQIEEFYEDLYSSKITVSQEAFDEFIRKIEIPELNNEEQETMEGIFTLEECKKILESFEDNKSPGEDRFTAEFYKHFFDLIGFDLVQSLNQAFEDGELSISQRRGVITLIPKEDSDLLDIQNWRPITLLNIDYKIASKALAKRIESVLPKLVHLDQTGFMKGRYIGENIRKISDVMEYTMSENKGGILVSLDFKKAFDTLKWQILPPLHNKQAHSYRTNKFI